MAFRLPLRDNPAVMRSVDPEGAHLAALRRLAAFRGQRVLEVGCGDGRLTLGVAADGATVLAFDPDPATAAACDGSAWSARAPDDA